MKSAMHAGLQQHGLSHFCNIQHKLLKSFCTLFGVESAAYKQSNPGNYQDKQCSLIHQALIDM